MSTKQKQDLDPTNVDQATGEKRAAEEEGNGPSKRPALDSNEQSVPPNEGDQSLFTSRSIILTKLSGYVIGKGGSTAKWIRDQTGTKVSLSEVVPGSNERILTISGTLEGVAKAYHLIVMKYDEPIPEKPAVSAKDPYTNKYSVKILVGHTQVGCIIGKAGSKIKQLQEETGAHVVLSEDVLPNSTERSVTISGTPDQIHECIKKVLRFLLERPPDKSNSLPYRPAPGISTSSPHAHSSHVSAPPGAPHALVPHAPYLDPYGTPPKRERSYPVSMPVAGAYPPPAAYLQGAPQTQQFLVPNELVGCIIGKGGSRISEIRQVSGSQIRIGEIQPGTNDRIVSVIGTSEGNQAAVYLLYHRLQSEKARLGLKHV